MSVSALQLLHCIPLPAAEKAASVFNTLRAHLAEDDVLAGAPGLGSACGGAPVEELSWFGR